MGKSIRLRASDVAGLLRLGNRLQELPAGERVVVMLEDLCKLTGAQVGILVHIKDHRPGGKSFYVGAEHGGWMGETERAAFTAYLGDDHAQDPFIAPMTESRSGVVTRVRQQLLDDVHWYGCRHVNEYRRIARVDHALYSSFDSTTWGMPGESVYTGPGASAALSLAANG